MHKVGVGDLFRAFEECHELFTWFVDFDDSVVRTLEGGNETKRLPIPGGDTFLWRLGGLVSVSIIVVRCVGCRFLEVLTEECQRVRGSFHEVTKVVVVRPRAVVVATVPGRGGTETSHIWSGCEGNLVGDMFLRHRHEVVGGKGFQLALAIFVLATV